MTESVTATLLLVDDSEDNRYTIGRHLRKAGFRIVEAATGEETLRLARDNPDLVILDIDLPDMNGFDICRQIKADPTTATIPVLHLSATFTKTRDRVQGLDGGAEAYLCHPVEPLELVATVNALLRARRAEQALLDASRRKDEFMAMLAHELRNPLAPIRNAVEILRLRGSNDPAANRAREIVDRQVTHMSRLIDDLLDVARIARGKVSIKKRRCDLAQIVRETVNDYRGPLEAGHLSLELVVPDQPVWVLGDRTRLSQVVGNILNNAQKFTDSGGSVRVEVTAGDAGGAEVVVRDSGIGMDADTLRYVFEPFAQADRSLDRSRGGLGLGLALVKGLVDLHGGTVRAASEGLDRGTTIIVRLPLAEQPEPPPQPVLLTPAPRRACRVLVVEDGQDAAASLQMLLEIHGHEVRVAHTGPTGLEIAKTFRPELVLCDIGLPGTMDGFAVARAMRAAPATAAAFLVAITGYGQPEDQIKAREAGFDQHMTKPVEWPALTAVLAAVTQRT
ncbi:response regulator [Fimbriiglobus ruber]|nr:response regulator [Fimbriiglobus ruber]